MELDRVFSSSGYATLDSPKQPAILPGDMSMQSVILAGGLGTRLGSLTGDLPKPMVDIHGRPFLAYELDLLKLHRVNDIILCVGHRAETIKDYFGDGSKFGVKIRYSLEPETLMGTAGAVKQAEAFLNDVFFLVYADSYMPVDYAAAYQALQCRPELGMMVVLRNENRYEQSNLIVDKGLIKAYDKTRQLPGMDCINFGVSVLHKESLRLVPEGVPYSQEEWYQQLIRDGNLAAFETEKRFYEIGSPDGLAEFRRLVAEGALP